MKKILNFLATDGAFVFEEHDCRLVDSEYIPAFGGTGSITLRNEFIALRFCLDRDRLTMEVKAANDVSPYSWFSLDIIRQVLTGEIVPTTTLTSDNVVFIRSNFLKIQDLFKQGCRFDTEKRCREFEAQRSKRLFG